MKPLILLISFILAISIISCNNVSNSYDQASRVVISGKVLTPDSSINKVSIGLNLPGLGQELYYSQLNSEGAFEISFETYRPTDLWLIYKTSFLVIVHPGDSIYIEFDGNSWWRPEILKSVRFEGIRKQSNEYASQFQRLYFSNPIYTNDKPINKAISEYEPEDFLKFLDTLKMHYDSILNSFVSQYNPNDEVKEWASTYLESSYYKEVVDYPLQRGFVTGQCLLSPGFPDNYFDAFLSSLPLSDSMLISGYSVIDYINLFQSYFILVDLWQLVENKKYIDEKGFVRINKSELDSLRINYMLSKINDDLFKQLLLTNHFKMDMETSGIELFEKYIDVIEKEITLPFLINPLKKRYAIARDRLLNPTTLENTILISLDDVSSEAVFDSILNSTNGKVSYIDCWATWCGPCMSEFPESKRLMELFKDDEVNFLFLCLESDEDKWKATIDEFDLGGIHYFLTRNQGDELKKTINLTGYPFYLLVDSDGNIIEKGSHLRPSLAEEKIFTLIKRD